VIIRYSARLGALFSMLVVLTAVLAGCEHEASEPAPVLEAPELPWRPGEGWRLSEDPVLTIGALDGADAIGTVGRVADQSGIVLLGDGRIVIADGDADEVRIYDAAGSRSAVVGRTGDGPGEFRGIRGVLGFGPDSLLVWDSRVRSSDGRLSVVTADGTFVRTISVPGLSIRSIAGITERGTILVEPEVSAPADWIEPDTGEYRERRIYERLSLSGERLGSFGPVQGRERVAASATLRGFVHFGRDTYVGVGAHTFYTGDSESFEIVVHDPESGVTLRSVSRPYEGIPVTEEELAESIEVRTVTNPLMNVTDRLRAIREQRPAQTIMDPKGVPARNTHPAFNRLIEDPHGYLWVRHVVGTPDSLQTWSIFNPAGMWLGEVHMPLELNVRAISSDRIAGVVRDQLEVEYVHVFQLIR
jgi:hypothetical protein